MIDAGAALRYLLSPVQDSLGGGCQHQFIHYFRSFNSQCGTNINHDRNIPYFSHSPLLKECQYHINVFFTLSLSGNQCQCHLYVNVTHQVAFPPIIPITQTSSPPSCGSLLESMSMSMSVSPLCQCHGSIMWLCSWQPQWFGETWGLWGFGETHGVCLHLQQGSWGRTSEASWSILPKEYIFHLSG